MTITHPDRVLDPESGLVKADLARYLELVAGPMLPHVEGRPLMLRRCPEGRTGTCFWQKHIDASAPKAVGRARVQESAGPRTWPVVEDRAGLVSLVQMGSLEVHVWDARARTLERPDRMVFDLDPDPAVPWREVVRAAHQVRERLEQLGLGSFAKTTGGKGIHVVVPLRPAVGWDDVRSFSAAVAEGFVREDPARWTHVLSKARRAGRILLDTFRNGRGSTWVAPWSPRAREGLPVSMPVPWSAVTPALRPDRFTVRGVLDRGPGADAWKGMDALRQTLTRAMRRAAGVAG